MLAELLAQYTAPAEGFPNAGDGHCWEVGLGYSPTVRNPCFMICKLCDIRQVTVLRPQFPLL